MRVLITGLDKAGVVVCRFSITVVVPRNIMPYLTLAKAHGAVKVLVEIDFNSMGDSSDDQ